MKTLKFLIWKKTETMEKDRKPENQKNEEERMTEEEKQKKWEEGVEEEMQKEAQRREAKRRLFKEKIARNREENSGLGATCAIGCLVVLIFVFVVFLFGAML